MWLKDGEIRSRKGLLKHLVRLSGIYIPSFYDVCYSNDGTVRSIRKKVKEAPLKIKKNVVTNLNTTPFPVSPIVPSIDVVHNRINLEIFRGCTRGCRFCQAGMIYRPVRERSENVLLHLAEENVKNTGYEEISLSSLSSSDYSQIDSVIKNLVDRYQEKGVGVSLPSLRIDSFSVQLARQSQRVRKTGLTFAPEVGSKRMSNVVNKNVTEDDLYQTLQYAFQEGCRRIKLYFMIGLPTEQWDDIEGIIRVVKEVESMGKSMVGRKFSLNVSINAFVPKSHTPFQWTIQERGEQLREKFSYIVKRVQSRNISVSFPDINVSLLEAVFARGDRRLGKVLEEAYKIGCKFDSWREYFHLNDWIKAFKKCQLDISFYAHRERKKEEKLPWDIIDCGITKDFLWLEWQKALQGITTNDCRFNGCKGCGLQDICQGIIEKRADDLVKSEVEIP